MAKLDGGEEWAVLCAGALSWPRISLTPAKPSAPISRAASTTPTTPRFPPGNRNRLDEETLPLTISRLSRNVAQGAGLRQETSPDKFGQRTQLIEDPDVTFPMNDHELAARLAGEAGRLLLGVREEFADADANDRKAAGDKRSHDFLMEV